MKTSLITVSFPLAVSEEFITAVQVAAVEKCGRELSADELITFIKQDFASIFNECELKYDVDAMYNDTIDEGYVAVSDSVADFIDAHVFVDISK